MLKVRWFGEPWPSRERRAPVCEDDAMEVPVPVGRDCIECDEQIGERDHGVITSCSPSIWGYWRLEIDGVEHPVCAYHLHCFLKNTLGPELGPAILARMRERPNLEVVEPQEPLRLTAEDVQVGRGWRKGENAVEEVPEDE